MATGLRKLFYPITSLAKAYGAAAQRRPAEVGLITTVVKTSAADMFAQQVVEKKKWEEMDWKRHAVFVSFGFMYLGGFQYWLYNHLFVRMCAGMTARMGHLGSAPIKTFIDQAIHHPFFYFPTLYLMKGVVEERPVASTLVKYREDLWENCKALWTIWVPAQLVNFAVVPRHLRIPFVAGVSFLWTVVISNMRGAIEMAQQAAPSSAEIEQAVAGLTAAAVTPAAAEVSSPTSGSVLLAGPAAPSGQGSAAPSGSSTLLAAGGGGSGGAFRASDAHLGLKALVPPGEARTST